MREAKHLENRKGWIKMTGWAEYIRIKKIGTVKSVVIEYIRYYSVI